jgi:glycosyltransferase involved in cell wall biosynthesis
MAVQDIHQAPPTARASGGEADPAPAVGVAPTVSVLVTAHNAGRYIRTALESLQKQTLEDIEIVVVDDGSTDDTADIVGVMAAEDPRIRLIRGRVCVGISRAANRGLAACRADIIARMDADDVAYPDRLEKQLAFFRASDAVAVGCYVEFIDAKGRQLTVIESPTDNDTIQDMLLQGDCTLWHTGSMIDAAALRRVNGYNVEYGSAVDVDLWLRLGEVGKLANQPEVLQQYRFYNASVSAKKRDQQMNLCRRATLEAAERRGVEPRFQQKDHWRAGSTRASRLRFTLRLGWWAFRNDRPKTTAIYAVKSLGLSPLSREPWAMLRAAGVAQLRQLSSAGNRMSG